MNILIIDDDSVDRMDAERTLHKSALPIRSIDQTAYPEVGIEKARTGSYDVILLDYQIPPSNGIEILRELRGGQDFSTAILMLSHSHDEELALNCIEAGAQDFIMKNELSGPRLKRAILLASERHHLQQQVNESHMQLKRLAEQDTLTGLSNRYFFDEAIKDAIPKAIREKFNLGLLLLDLDNFKHVNDTYGHIAGDGFLQEVAKRLKTTIRDGDKLCRLGGDEFAILVDQLSDSKQIYFLVKRIFKALEQPYTIEGKEVEINVSIGVATFPECAQDAVEFMKCADVAMYRAKAAGRNQAQYYSKDFHKQMNARVNTEIDLKKAIKKKQFVLYYQPQISTRDHRVVGVEALIRWQHPTRGMIAPGDFIPIAEESECILEIGRWVIQEACRQFSHWIQATSNQELIFSIAVNLSAKQLRDAGVVDLLAQCLKDYSIPAQQIELELTESSLDQSTGAVETINKLSGLGVRLALDDFGTGYSSLSQLKEYPFDILKIDKSFIRDLNNERDADMLKAITSFAHSLNYETVAEGVETEIQRDICTRLEVDRLQGYLFAKPLPAEDFETQWIER